MVGPGIVQIAPIAREILAELTTRLTLVGADVVDEFVSNGEEIRRNAVDRESIIPTAVVEFGEPSTQDLNEGIVWNRGELETFPFAVLLLANDGNELRVLRDVVVDALQGLEPNNCGPIRKLGSGPRVKVSSFLNPLRFAQTIGFALTIGTIQLP